MANPVAFCQGAPSTINPLSCWIKARTSIRTYDIKPKSYQTRYLCSKLYGFGSRTLYPLCSHPINNQSVVWPLGWVDYYPFVGWLMLTHLAVLINHQFLFYHYVPIISNNQFSTTIVNNHY